MTDWNTRYDQHDTPWDKGVFTPVLKEITDRYPDLFAQQSTIIPGCGTGHDALWLAQQGAIATGVDIAPLAIERAIDLDTDRRVNYHLGNILDPDESPFTPFDRWWEHTCFCAIDPSLRPAYIEAAQRLIRPGGIFIGVFFIHPEMDEGEDGPPFGIEVQELETLWQGAGFSLLDSWTPMNGFVGRIGRERVMIFRRGN